MGERRCGPVFRQPHCERLGHQAPLSDRRIAELESEAATRLQARQTECGKTLSRKERLAQLRTIWRDIAALKEDRVRVEFMRVARRIGLPQATAPKSLRHSFATALQDANVTSRTIRLVDAAGNNPVYANVYGAERQPCFSALLIDYEPTNSNPNLPYIVIELYNPHPVPIRMTGWKLASLNRSGGTISLTEVGDLYTTLKGAARTGGQTGAVILPGERIILQNDPALQPPNIKNDWSANTITGYTNQSTTGANLDMAVGNELVLLRPRVTPPDGVAPHYAPPSYAPENTYDESKRIDLVPLDNLDLVDVAPSAAVPPQPLRLRYARANKMPPWSTQQPSTLLDDFGGAWNCIYPGPYNLGRPIVPGPNSPAFPFHHLGLLPVLATGALADNGNFGRPNSLFAYAPTPTSGNGSLTQLNQSYASYAPPGAPFTTLSAAATYHLAEMPARGPGGARLRTTKPRSAPCERRVELR